MTNSHCQYPYHDTVVYRISVPVLLLRYLYKSHEKPVQVPRLSAIPYRQVGSLGMESPSGWVQGVFYSCSYQLRLKCQDNWTVAHLPNLVKSLWHGKLAIKTHSLWKSVLFEQKYSGNLLDNKSIKIHRNKKNLLHWYKDTMVWS